MPATFGTVALLLPLTCHLQHQQQGRITGRQHCASRSEAGYAHSTSKHLRRDIKRARRVHKPRPAATHLKLQALDNARIHQNTTSRGATGKLESAAQEHQSHLHQSNPGSGAPGVLAAGSVPLPGDGLSSGAPAAACVASAACCSCKTSSRGSRADVNQSRVPSDSPGEGQVDDLASSLTARHAAAHSC
jgi:hypothetical protein